MKKSILMLMMLLMLAFASVCSAAASNGKILDAEEAMANKFLTANNYSAVTAILADNMKKEVTTDVFNNIREQVDKTFGKVEKLTLRFVEKYDDGDVLIYLAKFDKVPEAEYIAIFELKGDKPLLTNFTLRLPPSPEEKEAKK